MDNVESDHSENESSDFDNHIFANTSPCVIDWQVTADWTHQDAIRIVPSICTGWRSIISTELCTCHCYSIISISLQTSTDIQGGPKIGTIVWYALLNIERFSKLFGCHDHEKICNNTITKDPTTPQVCRHWVGQTSRGGSLIVPLVSAIAGFSASSSSKANKLNIWCKNCSKGQLLSTITETINTFFRLLLS